MGRGSAPAAFSWARSLKRSAADTIDEWDEDDDDWLAEVGGVFVPVPVPEPAALLVHDGEACEIVDGQPTATT